MYQKIYITSYNYYITSNCLGRTGRESCEAHELPHSQSS